MASKCPNCGVTGIVKTIIRRGELVQVCDSCTNSFVRPNELAAKNRRDYQRGEYRRDIAQPFEKDYVKARGIEAAREKGWTDEQIRKHS
jgi:hypothetical protein